jgi:hypothetical protein
VVAIHSQTGAVLPQHLERVRLQLDGVATSLSGKYRVVWCELRREVFVNSADGRRKQIIAQFAEEPLRLSCAGFASRAPARLPAIRFS